MQQLSNRRQQAIESLSERHGFSPEAVSSMLQSIIDGGGGMAQFSHPEFSGAGQWMRGGMIMVSDMSNDKLKSRVAALCDALSDWVRDQPDTSSSTTGSSQASAAAHISGGDWWPESLGSPDSSGSQNGMRYAVFGQKHRLAIDSQGQVTVYDTLDHRIGGISQQQSGTASLRLQSQHGPVELDSLPVVS